MANTVDPLAGSYAIEALTNQIEAGARDLIATIDRMGGTLAAIEAGFIQRSIQEAAYQTQKAIDDGTQVVVGRQQVHLRRQGRQSSCCASIRPSRREQVERLRQVRASRSADGVVAPPSPRSARAAKDGANLMPPIITAVEARATVGEISNALRDDFGEYREAVLD